VFVLGGHETPEKPKRKGAVLVGEVRIWDGQWKGGLNAASLTAEVEMR